MQAKIQEWRHKEDEEKETWDKGGITRHLILRWHAQFLLVYKFSQLWTSSRENRWWKQQKTAGCFGESTGRFPECQQMQSPHAFVAHMADHRQGGLADMKNLTGTGMGEGKTEFSG